MDLPVPKFDGFKGKLLDGWEVSGILSFQTGFPVRITSQDDVEQLDTTFDFERRQPNFVSAFKTVNPRNTVCAAFTGPLAQVVIPRSRLPACFRLCLRSNLFTNATVAPGTIGNAPRSICCGPESTIGT